MASPAEINLNQWFQSGDQAYILVSAALVFHHFETQPAAEAAEQG